MFIIDKLNEGLHLEEVHGCILLRTTVSNIIYYQQIGRAIDAGSNEQRVILDLVSNFNSLKSFNLKKELAEKVQERRSGSFPDCSEDFELEKFDVVDLIQSCLDIFNKIDEEIMSKDWSEYEDSILIKYYNEIGVDKICELNLLPGRSKGSIRNRAKRLGLMKKQKSPIYLSDEDKKIIQIKYAEIGLSGLIKLLPHYSKSTIWRYIKELPEYKKSERRILTEKQKEFILQNYNKYSNKELEDILELPERTICSFANANGLKKIVKPRYVYYDKSKEMWAVIIRVNGINKHFGSFIDKDEAGRVALEKAKEYGKVI